MYIHEALAHPQSGFCRGGQSRDRTVDCGPRDPSEAGEPDLVEGRATAHGQPRGSALDRERIELVEKRTAVFFDGERRAC
jgi:hypothetical protein